MADGTGSCSSGLVPSKTTSTGRIVGVVTKENSHHARLKRMRRSVLNFARHHIRSRRGFRDQWKMLTCTYREDVQWESNHVRQFLNRLAMWLKRRRWPVVYVWVLELTKRGRPHYHVLIRVPHGQKLPYPDDVKWWPHGKTNLEAARNAVGYLAKYASKGVDQAELPKGARIYAFAGLDREGRTYVQFWNLPHWARDRLDGIERTKRITGGFVVLGTGEFLATPYECIYKHGQVLILLKEQNP